ncbi:hypothetical protein BpHYR1_026047 [Brachionus plicatilis]|uniref:Uncharacterized protein n=1 Tax=Brachionus plicatilis TaxID=10195 RepID=A0A3M7T0M7_BRAPC|nr:hypothetical protein BpHYR1_026047 [Brachionus plicatilis]
MAIANQNKPTIKKSRRINKKLINWNVSLKSWKFYHLTKDLSLVRKKEHQKLKLKVLTKYDIDRKNLKYLRRNIWRKENMTGNKSGITALEKIEKLLNI